jgi:hypothetical protein
MKHGIASGLGLALAWGCAPKPAATANQAAPEGGQPTSTAPAPGATSPDFDALLARESTGLVASDLKGPAGAFTTRVSSKGAVQTALSEGIALLDIPIGAESPVHCQVFPGDVDPGGTLSHLFEDARKNVEFRQMTPWSVTAIGGAPAAFVRGIYLSSGPRGKSLGQLKAMINTLPGHTVLCVHDELGYEKTFTTVVTELGEHLEFSGAKQEAPHYIEIQRATTQGVPIAFARIEMVNKPGKHGQVVNGFAMIPISEAEIRFDDYYEVQELDATEHLATGVWVDATNNQLGLKLKIEHGKGGTYTYAGEEKGKPVNGTFTTKDKKPLSGYLLTARALAPHAKDAKPFSVEELEYNPQLELTAPTTVRYFREAGESAGSVRVAKAKGTEVGTLDEHGLMEKMTVSGNSPMEVSRVFVKGKP